MRKLSRRRFLTTTAGAGATALVLPWRNVLGANDSVRLGFIGVGGRGSYSADWFKKLPDVRVAALCDADAKHLDDCHKKFPGAKTQIDLRRVIDDKDVDAVVISTCNHWHALAAVWACQAGKDVYVEKPISNNVWEGRKIVEAARSIAQQVKLGELDPADITEQVFAQHLYTRNIPDPDLLIRTSGEMRISNFLLWQISYAELLVTPTLWPDFRKPQFYAALEEYNRRHRRFGGL